MGDDDPVPPPNNSLYLTFPLLLVVFLGGFLYVTLCWRRILLPFPLNLVLFS